MPPKRKCDNPTLTSWITKGASTVAVCESSEESSRSSLIVDSTADLPTTAEHVRDVTGKLASDVHSQTTVAADYEDTPRPRKHCTKVVVIH